MHHQNYKFFLLEFINHATSHREKALSMITSIISKHYLLTKYMLQYAK